MTSVPSRTMYLEIPLVPFQNTVGKPSVHLCMDLHNLRTYVKTLSVAFGVFTFHLLAPTQRLGMISRVSTQVLEFGVSKAATLCHACN